MQDLSDLPASHNVLGILNLSGETVAVGIEHAKNDPQPSIFYRNEVMAEPHYLGISDAKVLVALLQLAIAEATGAND